MISNLIQDNLTTTYHLPQDYVFHTIASFKETMLKLKAEDFVNTTLPLDDSLNFQDLMKFIVFRFWYAWNKFPLLQQRLEKKYERIIGAFSKNDEDSGMSAFKSKFILQKCLLWHLSRALPENVENIVDRNLPEFDFTVALDIDEDPQSIKAVSEIKKHLMKLFDSAAFQEAVKTFSEVIKTPLPPEKLPDLLDELKNLKIIPISITPSSLYGMVLPSGIALSFGNILGLIDPEREKPDDAMVKIGLWIVIQQVGHIILCSEPMNQKQHFAKITPPSEYSYAGQNFQNLEAGFLFSLIFLGSFDKKIWEKQNLLFKFMQLNTSDPQIPILSLKDLEGVDTINFTNLTNSGALMMRTKSYQPIKL